jgi:AraC-like DNA-binding protein
MIATHVHKTAGCVKTRPHYEPHLVVNEIRLQKGGEWAPDFRGWCLSHVGSGISYWQEPGGTREVAAGSLLVLPSEARGVLRASQLNEVAVTYYCVEIEKLLGLLSLREQHFFSQAAGRKSQAARVVTPDSPMPERFKTLCSHPGACAVSTRLRLLQFFMDLFEWNSDRDQAAPAAWMDGRKRFRKILNQMAAAEFVEMSVSELAPMMSCSPRHLNRLFREELGASFREKQIELRLVKACELLATSSAKVVEVALESGYQSSSVFSELFKRHFGVSPGQWRRQCLHSRGAERAHL